MDKTLGQTTYLQERAVELLAQICYGLEGDNIPCPPELLDWYLEYQKEPKIILE